MTRLAPNFSDWVMIEARLRTSSRSVRHAHLLHGVAGGAAELDLALDDVQFSRQGGVGRPQFAGDPLQATPAGSGPLPGR